MPDPMTSRSEQSDVETRWILVPANGGHATADRFVIERRRRDPELGMFVHAGYLCGGLSMTREQARNYMLSGVER